MKIPHVIMCRMSQRIFSTLLLILLGGWGCAAVAHPLGNFTVNHFSRINVGAERIRLRYVIDMAEIPTFQESQAIDTNQDGKVSNEELNAYLERAAPGYAEGLLLTIDGARLPATLTAKNILLQQGAGGLPTLRIECDFEAAVPKATDALAARRLHFEDTNSAERIGWRELVVQPEAGVAIFDTNAYGSAMTDELRAYPQDMLITPLNERVADLSWTSGAIPIGAVALRTRDGHPVEVVTDRFAELIRVQELTPLVAMFGLLLAAGLGAVHAFSPGHGKTVVGAYLVGTRGTAKHAAFLGLTVTITHTIGVIALGLITLFAAHYILPERLIPILGFISGAIVLLMGLSLFVKRLRVMLGASSASHQHDDEEGAHAHELMHDGLAPHAHGEQREHSHAHQQGDPTLPHSHGGSEHTHLPPGATGGGVTWRSLLALGVSGGLLPCPSALVVMLGAITADRIGYGLALVVAFSVGLAATLTAIGLIFVYAGRFISHSIGESRLLRFLPVASALVIACLGAALCYEALAQAGVHLPAVLGNFLRQSNGAGKVQAVTPSLASLGVFMSLRLKSVSVSKHSKVEGLEKR